MYCVINHLMPKIEIFGVQIDAIRLEDLLAALDGTIASGSRALVSHVNVTGLNLAYEQAWLRNFYNTCDWVFCDGMGVLLGARLLGNGIPERFTLADWVWSLAEMSSRNGYSLYLLGNPPGVAQRAASVLQSRFPELQIAGTHHGFFNKDSENRENQAVLEGINTACPDILLVGFGMPLQERWLGENWPQLNVRAAITCGALFEYLSGDLPRGPRWMTENYLEWLARILISPRRYARRYLRDIPLFLFRILKQKIGRLENG